MVKTANPAAKAAFAMMFMSSSPLPAISRGPAGSSRDAEATEQEGAGATPILQAGQLPRHIAFF
jgi:hypothetical protein